MIAGIACAVVVVGAAVKLGTVIGLACLVSAMLLGRNRRQLACGFATIAFALGVGSLVEHACGIELGIDHGLAAGALGRIGPNTAILLALLASGVFFAAARTRATRWLADGCTFAALAFAALAVLAALFGASAQYPFLSSDPLHAPAAIIGCLLGGAMILQQADRGLGRLLRAPTGGGAMARRLVPALLVIPVVLARIVLLGLEADLYDRAFAAALIVIASVAIIVLVVVASARMVDRVDTVRRGNEAQIRQMAQDIARQSEEVHRSNRELESFSYSVSHDLRAPIRHIASYAELLEQHAAATLDAKGRRYLATIAECAGNAARLIDALLDFSRMGRAALHPRDLDVRELVETAWQHTALERAGRVVELELGTVPRAYADPATLQLVVDNLLSNAIKYTAPVERARVSVTGRAAGDEVLVTVRDNGVGFDPSYADKLFGVFQRLHGDEFEGVGIGLANVRRIVERHGGRAWAEGELGKGASFHFTLPRAKEVS